MRTLSLELVVLFARRVASLGAFLLVLLVGWMAADPTSAWWFSIATIALISTARAAALPNAWLKGEGDWIGTAALRRSEVLGAAWTGSALGTLLLAGAAAGAIAVREARLETTVLLEPSSVGGPQRSLVLMPGESFEQPFASDEAWGREVRVRATPTLGAGAPTTRAFIEAGKASRRINVARRTWLDVDLQPYAGQVRVTNVGDGALAILGPFPVEVWAPSGALLGGHLRVWGHAASFLVTLTALALMLGIVMGPGIAALFACSLWLGAWMLVGQGHVGAAADWLPGGPALGRALDAVSHRRSPLPVAISNLASTSALLAFTWFLGSQLLRTWRDEVRG